MLTVSRELPVTEEVVELVEVDVVVEVDDEVEVVVVVLDVIVVVVVELVVVVEVADACISTATSSQKSPRLAVQPSVTWPGDDAIFELEAPVMALGTLTSHCCAPAGEPSVTPPYIDGRSSTQLFEYFAAMEMDGLPAAVLCWVTAVGIGVPWSTPERAYAPITADVEPAMATTMFAVPVGFCRYHNSASLLLNEAPAFVKGTPPNVTEFTYWAFALTPTTSRRLVPAPASKLEIVNWYGDADTAPDVVWTRFATTPDVAVVVVDVEMMVVVVVVAVVVVVVAETA
jgi:hypothetical protein